MPIELHLEDSERLRLQAEEKQKLANKQQQEIDLRARQIDKPQQEITMYEGERDKYAAEAADMYRQAEEKAAE